MKLKLLVLLVSGVAVMFGLGWVPIVKVQNGDSFEVTCRACPRALYVGWGEVEREPTGAGHQTGGTAWPSSGTWSGSDDGPSPNDQRSNVMNPNNPQYQSAIDNRSNQLNPNNPAYRSSRGR